MTETVLGIYNAAISAAEGRGRLTSLDESSREREECDLWYGIVRDTVQEATHWPACRASSRLTLVATRNENNLWTSADPEHPFKYAYSLPSDCLRPWYLTNYQTFQLSYDIDNDRTLLSTNSEQAILIYARRNNIPSKWTPGQRQATLLALSAMITPGISGDRSRQATNYQLANQILLQAQSDALNSSQNMLEVLPPELASRGYEDMTQTQFYYPFGSLFVAGTDVA